ncbi:MAG: alpha-amylase family glycosyl hydrolase [Anaerolineales bacterium]
MADDFVWWRDGIIYQLYPRSFYDSNQDGIGDLPGIISHLDYLAELGIDAIWLSPFYPSPDKDFGYDISDHCAVDHRFGTLEDFDQLVEQAHRRNLRVILDLVLNHTSNEHAWFLESRQNRSNPKADWYIWQDGIPNNWQSVFGGRAWTFDTQRGQYYYHMFLAEQPDVNWRNPEVRKAQLDVARFWLDRGVDGFRLDVFNVYFKDEKLRSNPATLGLRAFDRQRHIYDTDQPEMIPLLQELRAILDRYPDRYAVGETFLSSTEKIARYVGKERLHAAFDFTFLESAPQPRKWLQAILNWEKLWQEYQIWPNYVLSNHDNPRAATRYTKGEDDRLLKVLMMFLLTLRGTPFLYYGEEIGMRDVPLKRQEILDPPGKKYWPIYKGRDGCRAPMQWDNGQYGGFSHAKPWLPIHPDFTQRNVRSQFANPDSLLNFTRRLIALRRENGALQHGEFEILTPQPKHVLSYVRHGEGETFLIVLNFSSQATFVELPLKFLSSEWQIILTTHPQRSIFKVEQTVKLYPFEATICKF